MDDTSYDLWVRGELAGFLHLPDDGTRVEVIGGEIVVSPGPTLAHDLIVSDISDRFAEMRATRGGFTWRCVQTTDLNLVRLGDGYVPDLLVIDAAVAREARQTGARYLLPPQVDLAVEVTSPSNAAHDREPGRLGRKTTKWGGYASTGIPYYLLIDRNPRMPRTTLYARPDVHAGTYEALTTWKFGETIRLPEPFGLDVPTDEWEPWDR
ncbi:Uma2 family endonuclease [Actinoallomurus rhizosphaericola]|uniref:Uma2 family endonuclease n=1 Tax=Actinoallomurus rhizosphaericola TaxID=2952536 RepID=UPI002091CC78|nr:Uma2 family endonuclease [Actinoallomurus rhizosphaericola]MCO5993072.1 Uma2 family endonuclease [Actinoallomurus rhizosphaericola]